MCDGVFAPSPNSFAAVMAVVPPPMPIRVVAPYPMPVLGSSSGMMGLAGRWDRAGVLLRCSGGCLRDVMG